MRAVFGLEEHGTTAAREAVAGVTTFFAMAYVFVVNPSVLSDAGMEWGAVFLATIVAALTGTLMMALVANVPLAQAPGMGINAFFAYTVVGAMGFTWQQALSMVFICGMVNILITLTRARKLIMSAIPRSLQSAIAGGIGLFIAYMGLMHSGVLTFGATPSLSLVPGPALAVFLAGLLLAVLLHVRGSRFAVIAAIAAASALAAALGLTHWGESVGIAEAASQLPSTFGAVFTPEGLPSLLSEPGKALQACTAVLMFCLVDTFDTIGTLLGAGRQTGLFSDEEVRSLEKGRFDTRLERALLSDFTATSVGAVVGTSNTTTLIESTAGVAAGGRTGLASVFTALCIGLCALFAPLFSMVPQEAAAGALVLVGVLMLSAFGEIDWSDAAEAVPAFFASVFMALCFNISYGIAAGFIFYCLVMAVRGRAKEVHPAMWAVSAVFLLAFALMAVVRRTRKDARSRRMSEAMAGLKGFEPLAVRLRVERST